MLRRRRREPEEPASGLGAAFGERLEAELLGNILPFWLEHVPDPAGGFHGEVTNGLQVIPGAPRSSVMCARVLWTFSATTRRFGDPAHRALADRARDELLGRLWDDDHDAVHWLVDDRGASTTGRLYAYGQAFAIYGLAEHHRATGDPLSLERARALFKTLEERFTDPRSGGVTDVLGAGWSTLPDARLDGRRAPAATGVNTLVHVVEAYAALERAAPDPRVRSRLTDLTGHLAVDAPDPATGHLVAGFDADWRPVDRHVTPGHDIEVAWLLPDAARATGDPALEARARTAGNALAAVVLHDGLGPEGLVRDEPGAWPSWAQAEGVIGFTDAYAATGDPAYAAAAVRIWSAIEEHFADRRNGEWFKQLDARLRPDPSVPKAGPWSCPYHGARACLETLDRIAALGAGAA